jgi:hypothetical protein
MGGGGAGGPSFAIYRTGASTVTVSSSALSHGSGGAGGAQNGQKGPEGDNVAG